MNLHPRIAYHHADPRNERLKPGQPLPVLVSLEWPRALHRFAFEDGRCPVGLIRPKARARRGCNHSGAVFAQLYRVDAASNKGSHEPKAICWLVLAKVAHRKTGLPGMVWNIPEIPSLPKQTVPTWPWQDSLLEPACRVAVWAPHRVGDLRLHTALIRLCLSQGHTSICGEYTGIREDADYGAARLARSLSLSLSLSFYIYIYIYGVLTMAHLALPVCFEKLIIRWSETHVLAR